MIDEPIVRENHELTGIGGQFRLYRHSVMSTQHETPTQIVKHRKLKKRRASDRPDALQDQFPTASREEDTAIKSNPTSKVQDQDVYLELASFTAALDAAAASFLNYVYTKSAQDGCDLKGIVPLAFTDLDERMEGTMIEMNYASSCSMDGCRDPAGFLQREPPIAMWGIVEALSRAALFQFSDQPESQIMTVIRNTVKEIEGSARKIPEILAEAVARKPLDTSEESLLYRRWNRVDMLLDRYHIENATSRREGVPTWSVLANIIKSQTIVSERPSGTRFNRISTSLWLCAFALLVTVPTTAQALRYSLHQPGTPRDADFWFQIQSSCMTILNLATLAIPIWKSKALPQTLSLWLWGLLTSASLGVGIAPVVYVFAPTEWSFLMNVFAGILQAFITLQIALVADTKGVESLKKE